MTKFLTFLAMLATAIGCHAQLRISQYPNTNNLASNQLFIVTAGNTNQNISFGQLLPIFSSGIGVSNYIRNLSGLGTNTTLYGKNPGKISFYSGTSPIDFYNENSYLVLEVDPSNDIGVTIFNETAATEWQFRTNSGPYRVIRQSDVEYLLPPNTATNLTSGKSLRLKAAYGIAISTNGSDLEISSLTNATNYSVTIFYAGDTYTTNLYATNIFTTVIHAGDLYATNIISTNIFTGTIKGNVSFFTTNFVTYLYATNAQMGDLRATNIYATNMYTRNIAVDSNVLSLMLDLSTNTASAPPWKEGRVYYDYDSHTLAYYNDQTNVTINVDQEQHVRAYNGYGYTVTNGSVVTLVGAHAFTPTLVFAQATTNMISNNYSVIGVVTEDIQSHQEGIVTTIGVVHGLDTHDFNAGDLVYLSTNAGAFTATKPTNIFEISKVGIVLVSNPVNGSLFVCPDETVYSDDVMGMNQYLKNNNASATNITLYGVPLINSTNLSAQTNSTVDLFVSGTAYINNGIYTNAVYTYAASASNAPAPNEFPSAQWVRSLFTGGKLLYNITNAHPVNTTYYQAADSTNTTGQVRLYTNITAGNYLGTGIMSTQKFTTIYSPMTVNAYMSLTGTGSPATSVHPEFYYTYDGTNLLGDYACGAQALTAAQTNLKTFVISFPTITATNSSGFYVVRRMKVDTQSGASTVVGIHGSGATPSSISFQNPPVTDISLGARGALAMIVTNCPAITNVVYDTNARTFIVSGPPVGSGSVTVTNVGVLVTNIAYTTNQWMDFSAPFNDYYMTNSLTNAIVLLPTNMVDGAVVTLTIAGHATDATNFPVYAYFPPSVTSVTWLSLTNGQPMTLITSNKVQAYTFKVRCSSTKTNVLAAFKEQP